VHGIFNIDRQINMKHTFINNTRNRRTPVENQNVKSDLYLDNKKSPYTRELQIWEQALIIAKMGF
jgi:hypothetical protein